MVALTRLNVTLYVHCLFRLFFFLYSYYVLYCCDLIFLLSFLDTFACNSKRLKCLYSMRGTFLEGGRDLVIQHES